MVLNCQKNQRRILVRPRILSMNMDHTPSKWMSSIPRTQTLPAPSEPVSIELLMVSDFFLFLFFRLNLNIIFLTGKFKEIAELTVRQEGLDEQVGNVLNLVARKIRPDQF